jgi:hypothetical protein
MKFKTCSCVIADQKCIITGFHFVHETKYYNGDLFKCNIHNSLSIHGVNMSFSDKSYGSAPVSSLKGYITCESEKYGQCLGGGEITLVKSDVDYVQKHHKLEPIRIDRKTTTLMLNGIEVEVEWTGNKGCAETRECPGEPAYIEIDAVWYKDINIQEVLDEKAEEELVEQLEKLAEDDAVNYAVDQAEYRNDCKRDDAMMKEWGGMD